MIIGLSGYATSGKDSFAEVFLREGYEKKGFADKLREFVAAVDPIIYYDKNNDKLLRYTEVVYRHGYNEAKALFPELRDILQRTGTDAGRRVLNNNVWVDALMPTLSPEKNYIFTDVRFVNEFLAVQENGGINIRISRPGVGPVNNHPSETEVDDCEYDLYVDNDGSLADLENKAITFLEELLSIK